ncbi:MAG TPA: DUF1080 domain-containing protein [Planctomicrobium sp.]|nr:DUF1080 domain-containing protein [Planctomicrobium sp.]
MTPSKIRRATGFGLPVMLGVLFLFSSRTFAETTVQAPVGTDLISASKSFPGETWRYVSGKKDSPINGTWSVRTDPESNKSLLVCTGEPTGYLLTKQTYEEFELELEWRYPTDINGNSGILLFINGEDHIWPTSVQVQLYQPEAGQTFPHGAAQTENVIQKVPALSKPVNHWNRCHVLCRNGTLVVTVNGQKVGEVTGCRPKSGAIGLQSEGAVVHFRNFIVRELPSLTTAVTSGAKDDRPGSLDPLESGVLPTDSLRFVVPSRFHP